ELGKAGQLRAEAVQQGRGNLEGIVAVDLRVVRLQAQFRLLTQVEAGAKTEAEAIIIVANPAATDRKTVVHVDVADGAVDVAEIRLAEDVTEAEAHGARVDVESGNGLIETEFAVEAFNEDLGRHFETSLQVPAVDIEIVDLALLV